MQDHASTDPASTDPASTDPASTDPAKASKCAGYNPKVIAKQYSSAEDALQDNNLNIFFDLAYDTSDYDFIKGMNLNKFSDHDEGKAQHLSKLLHNKHNYTMETALLEARYIVAHKRPVLEGHYAIIINDNPSNTYLIRDGEHNWVIDTQVTDADFNLDGKDVNDPSTICNLNKECIYSNNSSSGCVSHNIEQDLMYNKALGAIIKEFDGPMSSELVAQNEANLTHYRSTIGRKTELNKNYTEKQNRILNIQARKYLTMGITNEPSPHTQLLNSILSHPDFIEQQDYLIKFVNMFTTANTHNTVGEHWLYCNETKQKLLPTFMFRLASTFVSGGQLAYLKELDDVVNEVGVLSGDANAYVDRHSGFFIKNIDFQNTEEFTAAGI